MIKYSIAAFLKSTFCRVGIHLSNKSWQLGANAYYQCKFCKKRRMYRLPGALSPIDQKWLDGRGENPGDTPMRQPAPTKLVPLKQPESRRIPFKDR